MPPKTRRRKKVENAVTHVVGAYPLHLITTIFPNGEMEHFCTDARRPEAERVFIPLSAEAFDRLVRAAHAEATDNVAFFLHSTLEGAAEEGVTIYEEKVLS